MAAPDPPAVITPPPVREVEPAAAPPSSDTLTYVDRAGWLEPGTVVAGRYRILAMRGQGGMGVVYKARDEELSLDVGLKVLQPELAADAEGVQRFRRELILARQVTHPNVVRIHDIGESDGVRFLTMDFVEGRSLLEILQVEGTLPAERAVQIACQLGEALQRAHDAGIIHRDLKPGNVLVADDGTACITDFGVARSLSGERLTRAGAVVGTLDYVSPEQIGGGAVDGRSDLYSLGLLLCEMVTGRLPHQGGTPVESAARRLAGRAHVPAAPDVPRRV
ncbi:MAG: serine/threonine-protein kinase, partial [Vicinamibacterales bacterium]